MAEPMDEIIVPGTRPGPAPSLPGPFDDRNRGGYGFDPGSDSAPPEPEPVPPDEELPEVTVTGSVAPSIGFDPRSLWAGLLAAPAPRRAPRRRAPPRRSKPKPPPRRTPRRVPAPRTAPVRPGFPYLLPFRWTGLPSILVTAFTVGLKKLSEISDARVRQLIGAPPSPPGPPQDFGSPPQRTPAFPDELPEVVISAPRPLPEVRISPDRPGRPERDPWPLQVPGPGIQDFPFPGTPPAPEIAFPPPAPASPPARAPGRRPLGLPERFPLPRLDPFPGVPFSGRPAFDLTPSDSPVRPLSPGPEFSPAPEPVPDQAGCRCPEPQRKKRKRKKPRTECYRGSYRERSIGLTKRRRERIPCE